MLTVILLVVLATITILGISLQKTYAHVPPKELKRRTRAGDQMAAVLYRAVAYGASLRLLLWLVIAVASAAFFVVLARSVSSPVLALVGAVILVWISFVWLPQSKVTGIGMTLAHWLAPVLAWLLKYIYPFFDRLIGFIRRHQPLHIHTGLYQKEDLINLIERQEVQADNRLTQEELRLAANALVFGNKNVRDFMTPKRVVKTVTASDSIGPVLMKELHDSGFSRFPILSEEPDSIIGTLYMHDLVDMASGGKVQEVMRKQVYYIHEEQSLADALRVMLKTNHHLLIVVNSFEEFVGVLTIEDVMEQIIGHEIVDEFDQYENMRAVAQLQAKKDSQNREDMVK